MRKDFLAHFDVPPAITECEVRVDDTTTKFQFESYQGKLKVQDMVFYEDLAGHGLLKR